MHACVCAKSLQSCLTLCDPVDYSLTRLLCPWDSPGKNRVGYHAPLQGVFLTQGSNLHLLCIQHWQAGTSRGQVPLPGLESNDALPLAIRVETRLPWRPTRGLGTLDATHKVPRNFGLPREEH